jgi:hypothetical protein
MSVHMLLLRLQWLPERVAELPELDFQIVMLPWQPLFYIRVLWCSTYICSWIKQTEIDLFVDYNKFPLKPVAVL